MIFGPSIAAALELIADLFPDDAAIAQGDRTLTWQEFDDQAARVATFLAGQRIGDGDRLAIGTHNCPEYLVVLLAALKLGATPINLNFRFRLDEVAHVIENSGAKVLVHDDALAALIPNLVDRVEGLTAVPIGPKEASESNRLSLGAALRAGPIWRNERRGAADWMIYTGGTTGRPKAVAFTQASLLDRIGGLALHSLGGPLPQGIDELKSALIRRHPDRLVVLTASPLMHGTGIYGALTALLSGGTVVMLAGRRFDPVELAATIGRRRVTDLHIVGDVFALPLADELDAARARRTSHDLSSLRRVQSVGAAWSASVKRRLLAHADVTLIDMIAATEGGPFAMAVASRATDYAALNRFHLAPGARLLDHDDRDVAPGSEAVGVLAAPAQQGARYEGDPARSAAVFRLVDGILYSIPGDLAQIRADGSLRFMGRGSGVINTGGEKVYAAEVEDSLRGHPEVLDAVVVGVPDARWGAVVGAVVEAKPGHQPDPDMLAAHVATTLAGYKRPRRVAVVARLQRSAVGKADLAWARDVLTSDAR